MNFLIGTDGNFPAQSGSSFKLFQKENKIFFKINDSPLKKVYTLKTWIHGQGKTFLVFENLRGHIKSEKFIENLKNRILKKIKISDLPQCTIDCMSFEENHHIKIALKDD